MATIAKMVIAGIVDPTGVKKGLAESLAELQKFKRLAAKRVDMELSFPDLKKAEAAQKLLGGLTKAFDQEMAQAREGLFRGVIDTKGFKESASRSAKDFNKTLLAGIDQLRAQKLISPAIHQALVAQLKNAGLEAGTAFSKAASRGAAAHPLLGNLTTTGQRAANTLLNGLNSTFNSRISDLREQFANKLITVQQFRRKGQQAADEFDKGITAGLAKLRGKNQATKAITDALVESYKLAGTKAANQFQFSLDKQLGENVSRIGGTLTKTLTVPIVAAGVAAIKLGADFELSMNRIRGILQPTEEDMARLSAQARKIGAETQFSSRDAAEAQAFLAQQTHDVAVTLAAMPAVTQLAAAGLTDMSTAAEISTKILKGFGIPIQELGAGVDELVLLTSLGATNIHELGEAFKFVGPNARRLGQDFTTMGAALGALSARGQPGSLGGTALRGILQSLVRPSKQAAAALKLLDVEVKDSNNNFLDLIDIVRQFEDAQKRSTGQTYQFQQAIGTIFQQRAGTGFSNLLTIGSKELENLKKQLEAAGGTAKRVADVQMSGATGSFRELQSALEELALAFGDAGLLAIVTNIARSLANLVRVLKDANPGLLKFVSYFLLLSATLGPLLFSLGKTITLMATMRAILITLNGPTALAGLAASLAVGGAILVGLGLLAAIFIKVAADAANAKAKIEEFRASLSEKTVAQLEAMRADIVASVKFNTDLVAKLRAEQAKADPFLQGKGFTGGPGSQLQRITDLLREQQRMLADVDKALVSARKSAAELAKAGTVVTTLDETGDPLDLDTGSVKEAKTLIEQLTERVDLLTDATAALDGKIAEQPKIIDGLSRAWQLVNFWILQAGSEINETTVQLLKMRKELEGVFKNVDVILPKMTEDEFRRAIGADKPLSLQVVPMIKNVTFVTARGPLEKAVAEFEKAANAALSSKLDLNLLGKTENIAAVKVAAETYADALGKARVAESALAGMILASNLPLKEKQELIKKVSEAMEQLEKQEKKSVKNLQKMATSLQGIADGVRGILSIAEAFGQVDERVSSLLNSVADLTSSLSNVAQSLATGDVFGAIASSIGAIGSLIKLGQSLFGKSEGDKKREEIYRSNTAALAELKRSIDAWSLNVSVIGRSQPVIDATIANIREALQRLFGTVDLGKVEFKSIEEFDRQLRAAGSSFKEIQAIADELNIDLFNEKGRLSAAGLQALTEAMDLQRRKLTEFGKSLDDVRNRLELKRNVFNLDTSPVADLQQNIDLLRQFAPGIASMFAGFDAATAQGRVQIEKALQQLFTMLEQKMIDPTLFGDITLAELTGIIGSMATALDTFREATEEATKDMVNVPSGFKIARFAFQAQMTKAADATSKFADRVETVTPDDASPIQQLMLALGTLVPRVNDAKLPDLTPLSALMETLGGVATAELPAFAEALALAAATVPDWTSVPMPSVVPIQQAVTDIAGGGTAVTEALVAFAQRIRDMTIGAPTVDPAALPDLLPLTNVVTGLTMSGGIMVQEFDAIALSLRAARDALAGGAAIPIVPPDMTPLTNILTSVSAAGVTATTELNSFSTALRNATASVTTLQAGGAAATLSPAATVVVRSTKPVTPEPVTTSGNMTLIIQASVQQTQDPEEWYAGVKKIAKDKVRAKYGATAVTRVEENMP